MSDNFNSTYSKYLPVWTKQRDTLQSEEHIKQQAWSQSASMLSNCNRVSASTVLTTFSQYLRPTEGMLTSETGKVRYSNYLWRAKWYPFPLDTLDQALGLINNQPATFELPSNLEYLATDATNSQESLDSVLTTINSEQIAVSRVGILAEVTADPLAPFNIQFYKAETIVDWRVSIDKSGEEVATWVKLETDEEIDNNKVYLILMLDDEGNYIQYKTTNQNAQPELWGIVDEGYVDESFLMPMVHEQSSMRIPFVTINLSRLGLNQIQKPWLESISDSALKLFQASATYEDTLYWGAQSTFWATGLKDKKEAEAIKLGNGGRVSSSNENAKFGYASAGVDGIQPNKENVDNLKGDCIALGVDLINQGVESGTALDTRMSVKTASLKTLAKTGAEGLERLITLMAEWLSDNVDDVKVIPNLEFADRLYTADDLQKFGALVSMGSMLKEDLYKIMKRQNLTNAETFEDWDSNAEAEVMTGVI